MSTTRLVVAILVLMSCALTQACSAQVDAAPPAEPTEPEAAHCYISGYEGTLVLTAADTDNPVEFCCSITCFYLDDPLVSVAR